MNQFAVDNAKGELRHLIPRYSITTLYVALQEVFTDYQNELNELPKMFPLDKPVKKTESKPIQMKEVNLNEEYEKKRKDLITKFQAELKAEKKKEEPKKEEIKNIVIQQTIPEQKVEVQNKVVVSASQIKDADKQRRATHKEKIQKKNKELTEQGINPYSILTKEKLTEWLVNEKLSYWQIAERVGIRDDNIGLLAKQMGLQSQVSKLVGIKK